MKLSVRNNTHPLLVPALLATSLLVGKVWSAPTGAPTTILDVVNQMMEQNTELINEQMSQLDSTPTSTFQFSMAPWTFKDQKEACLSGGGIWETYFDQIFECTGPNGNATYNLSNWGGCLIDMDACVRLNGNCADMEKPLTEKIKEEGLECGNIVSSTDGPIPQASPATDDAFNADAFTDDATDDAFNAGDATDDAFNADDDTDAQESGSLLVASFASASIAVGMAVAMIL